DAAVGGGDVGGGEAGARRLGEGEGDDRTVVAVAERGVGDVDHNGRVLGVDGNRVGAGSAGVAGGGGVARQGHRDRALAGKAVIGGEGRGEDQRVGRGGGGADAAVGGGGVGGGGGGARAL